MEQRSYHTFGAGQAAVLRSASDYPVPALDAGAMWYAKLLWFYCNGIRSVRLAPGEFRSQGTMTIPANMTLVGSGVRSILAVPDGYDAVLQEGAELRGLTLACGKAPDGGGLQLGAGSVIHNCVVALPEPYDTSTAPDAVVCAQGVNAVVTHSRITFLAHKGVWTLDNGAAVVDCEIDIGAGRARTEADAVLTSLNATVRILGNRFQDSAATPAAYVAMYLVDGCVATGNDCGFQAALPSDPLGQIWIPATAAMCPVTENVAKIVTY